MILNIDLDGVVYDFHKEFTDYVAYRKNGDQWLVAPTTWNFWEQWGMSEGEWRGWFRRGVEDKELWRYGDEIKGASEYLWRLSDSGHIIRIVTYRLVHKFNHATSIKATVGWLDKHNIPYHDISFLSHRTSKDHIRADVHLDDNPNYLPRGLDPHGGKAFLFRRPWNEQSWGEFETVGGWQEFYERVEKLAAG